MSHSDAPRTSLEPLFDRGFTIMNQPIARTMGPELVAAVSQAGGLGVVPATDFTPEEIVQFCEAVKARTDQPFAVALDVNETPIGLQGVPALLSELGGLLEALHLPTSLEADHDNRLGLQPTSTYQERFEAALSTGPMAMIAQYGGFREPEDDRLMEEGVINMAFFTSLREAKVLRSAGCQVLIAQGAEASGPRFTFEEVEPQSIGLMTLVPTVTQVTGLPVVACGGLYCPEQMRALKTLGACGTMLGTALMATAESQADEQHRYWAREGQMSDTTVASTYHGRPARLLDNAFTGWVWEGEPVERKAYQRIFAAIEKAAREEGRDDLAVREMGVAIGRSRFKTVKEAVETLLVP